ncbi:MAG TPA: methylamine utilization protein MauJ [Bradyrhizobium sp.]|nr:methylamine utilization protein MauJ [Bradyrhizobium sp.]
MAAIGQLSLETNGTVAGGLGQLLVKPPKAEREFNYAGATFRVSPKSPFVVCCFSGAGSHSEVLAKGTELLQEGLDILSMTGGADLATRDANEEYIAWWKEAGTKVIAVASTATFSFSVGPIELEVRDASGTPVPPKIVIPQHHLAFRFYRLAQVSDDLFDAYRNMYLAFELLLSARYPKAKEREINWLRKSLTTAANELGLSNLVGVTNPAPIEYLIDALYTNTRLPLFHAKDGRAYFASNTANQDRRTVASSLELLTRIVIRMAEAWHHTRRIGGAVNLELMERSYSNTFDKVEFVAATGSSFSPEDELSNPNIRDGTRFAAKLNDEFNGEHRPHIQGRLNIPSTIGGAVLGALYIVDKEVTLITHVLDVALDIQGFDVLEACCFFRQTNSSEPRLLFPR